MFESGDNTELFLKLFETAEPLNEFGEPDATPPAQDTEPEPEAQPEPESETPSEEESEAANPGTEDESDTYPKPEKKVQTPEENAQFAEARRQKQMQERVEREAQTRLQSSPEYQMAQILANQYGLTTDQLLVKMQEAALAREAQRHNVPVEVLQQIQAERQRTADLEARLNRTEFDGWFTQKQNEMTSLKTKYSVLTDEDLNSAMLYQLNDLKNTQLPLEKAVFALHGDKIASHLQKTAKQEALAEISGRKQNPLAPQGARGSVDPRAGLSADELYVAKKMGLSASDYAKYKTES